jgi:methylmalonyl-CoA epimerase
MAKVVNINHVGILVQNIGKSLQFWRDILGIDLDYLESVPSFNVDLAFLNIDKTRIELMNPTTTQNNEYYELLQSNGPGFHHICLEVDNIDEMLEKLKFHNVKLKNETAIQLPGRKLAFLEPEGSDGVIIELYELN